MAAMSPVNLSIDVHKLQDAIDSSVSSALAKTLESYEVQKAIGASISQTILTGAVSQAINQAVSQIDTQALTQHLARELLQSITRVVVLILREGLVSTVGKLRGLPEYGVESKEARVALREELFGS